MGKHDIVKNRKNKMNLLKMIIFVIVIAIICIAIYMINIDGKDTKNTNQNNSVAENNKVEEPKEGDIITEEPKTEPEIQEEINNEKEDNPEEEPKNEEIGNEESSMDNENKAIELAKKEYGTTDGVYFRIEQTISNGIYEISVRDEETTMEYAWYTVDVLNGTVK